VVAPCLSRFDIPAQEYLSINGQPWDGIAVGALVFSTGPRVLLIQRSKTDSLPEKWEIPSGVVSNDPQKDMTITKAVARELWEEAGLTASRLTRLISAPADDDMIPSLDEGFVFSNSTKTKVFCRYVFEVEVEENLDEGICVKLNPYEHQDFVWATEGDLRSLRTLGDGRELDLTSDHLKRLILEGFKSKRQPQPN
jgi:8-oxo-dGTP pyrophosphatase MutT (NUDIX family)